MADKRTLNNAPPSFPGFTVFLSNNVVHEDTGDPDEDRTEGIEKTSVDSYKMKINGNVLIQGY